MTREAAGCKVVATTTEVIDMGDGIRAENERLRRVYLGTIGAIVAGAWVAVGLYHVVAWVAQ